MVKEVTGSGLILLLFLIALCPSAQSHPAHAKPVKYPYVVGFERFHSSLDDDGYLAVGGLILLNELNCVSCHAPPKALREMLPGVEGTRLAGVASRLSEVDLELMIRSPRFVKQDTIMPSFFAGRDRNLEDVEALKHFLSSLREEIPDYPQGDIETGRHFYHRIGCAACHAPEVGFRPDGIPKNAEIEMAGLPSVPMNLADLYDLDALTHFLMHPNQHRPSGRMPDFRLSEKEAVDLAAYLKAGPDLVLPENVTEALGATNEFILDEDLVEKGKALFVAKQCHACHSLAERGVARFQSAAASLSDLSVEEGKGCLAERPPGGAVPFYGLDPVQKRAIRAALERLDSFKGWDLSSQIDWRMKRLNCYACHERQGVGGAETAREVYFGFGTEKAIPLGRFGHLPPALDEVGAKLTPIALENILLTPSVGSVRPYLGSRMPTYLADEIRPLLEQFPENDQLPPPADEPSAPLQREGGEKKAGEDLFSAEGKNCQSCHGAGEAASSKYPGIDLSEPERRLLPDYFDHFLREPYSVHPPRIPGLERALEPMSKTDTEALWKWLQSVKRR